MAGEKTCCNGNPQLGDVFACDKCGMALVCVRDCECTDDACKPCLTCCGQEMTCDSTCRAATGVGKTALPGNWVQIAQAILAAIKYILDNWPKPPTPAVP